MANAIMMFAHYGKALALSTLLTAMIVPGGLAFAQGVATIVQTVKPADPSLAWQTPASVSFGTPLSSTQLNATAATAGKFIYQPPAGTILAPGQDNLTVNFVPDNPNFLTRTLSVFLNVTPSAVPSFSFVLTAQSATQPIPVQSGKPSSIHLLIAPIINVQETIVLSCPHPPQGRVCVFTPSTVQLASQPASVDLSLAPDRGNSLSPRSVLRSVWPGETARGDIPRVGMTILYPAFLFLGCLVNFVRRRVCMWLRHSFEVAAAIFFMILATSFLGCGSGFYALQHDTLTVVAASAFESHSVDIELSVVY